MNLPYHSAKPYTRWWWFSGEITTDAIRYQLDWLKRTGFGGVEIAWVYPVRGGVTARNKATEYFVNSIMDASNGVNPLPHTPPGPKWLSPAWSRLVGFTKRYADKLGLGCDFTFGSLWPFGGSIVPARDASRDFRGLSPQRLEHSWESAYLAKPGRILNHLDKSALAHYARRMGKALSPALKGTTSALFCDSWEVATEGLWTKGFDVAFRRKYGYALEPYMPELNQHPEVRYDYRQLISEYVLREFYQPFTVECHRLKARARVQCHGSPTDLLASYAAADIPESEAILFDPDFSVIPASAAALADKPVVSCESFTCLYGWKPRPGPAPFYKQEQTADLKLLADALFANGVNQIFWHGMPYNPKGGHNEFYATVHVGPESGFVKELPDLNRYLTRVGRILQQGKTYTDVAVYLPLEDTRMLNKLPKARQKPSAFYYWEQHETKPPAELKGYHPLWVSDYFLKDARYVKGRLRCGAAEFSSIYIDVRWLDYEALGHILRLARQGLPICLKRRPREPGRVKHLDYPKMAMQLLALPNVARDWRRVAVNPPLVRGTDLPDFWCRVVGEDVYIFFAHPRCRNLRYPLRYGQSLMKGEIKKSVVLDYRGKVRKITLRFKPYQSVLLKISADGGVRPVELGFTPRAPRP